EPLVRIGTWDHPSPFQPYEASKGTVRVKQLPDATGLPRMRSAGEARKDVTALALVLAIFGAGLVALALRQLGLEGHDFLLLYAAAHALRDHHNPYDAAIFLRYAQAAGVPSIYLADRAHRLSQPYVYAPLFAWLVMPLTYLKPLTALLVWRI